MKKLHILTLTWNAYDKLIRLKESLIPALNALNDVKYIWYIKDNASNDNTYEKVLSWNNPNINIIKYKDNLQNFAEGMNFLFDYANPDDNDLILLLNNDVIFADTKSLNNMIKILENDNSVGLVGARLLYTGTNKIQHSGVVFNKRTFSPMHLYVGLESDKQRDEKNREFQVVTGAVALTYSKYYKQAGKFDPLFVWAFDDVNFALSIKYNLNKKIVYAGKTKIYHDESASLKKNPINHMFMQQNLNLLRKVWGQKIVFDKELYEKNKNYMLYQIESRKPTL